VRAEPTFTIKEREVEAAPAGPPGELAARAGEGPGGSINLRFDWNEPVGAAVFRRAGLLWVAFDRPTRTTPEALRQAAGNLVRSIEQIPVSGGTVLRLDTVAGINPVMRREGLSWILDFRRGALVAQTPIEVKAQPESPAGPRVFVPVPEPSNPIAVTDPEVGDNLFVVPIIPLGHGILQGYDYPQFELFPTAQGVVVRPRIDTLRVRTGRQGIEVSSLDGLQVSAVSPEAEALAKLGPARPLTRALDMDKWKHVEPAAFEGRKQQLLAEVAPAKGAEREKARLDLARFFFANGFGAEALGVLDLVAADRPEIEKDAEFRLLYGASRYLMGHYEDARKSLAQPVLEPFDEATFWRAAVLAGEGHRTDAATDLRRTGAIVRGYPKALAMPLGMLVAEAALDLNDIKLAAFQIDALNASEPSPAQKGRIAYIEGRAKQVAGDFDGAIAKWEEAMKSPHRPSRAQAAWDRAELLLKLGRVTRAEAIEELEKLRFAWRGDDFEFNLLRRLGALYVEDGDFREGLRTLRQAATYFRTHAKAPEITQQMADIFGKLFLENLADKLPPVTAIALYDEFKELTPVGSKGDEMIRKLADRLAGVDLMDRAAELLKNQIEFRLKGVEKARVGAQLALVYLLDRKPDEALKALSASAEAGLPADLDAQRRHLGARALLAKGEGEAALDRLKDDKSLDADLLRTEIFWLAKDWVQAAQTLQRVLRAAEAQPRQPLDDEQAGYVMNLAIALTLSGNERAVARLKRDFGAAMSEGTFKDAFELITSQPPAGLLDYRQVAGEVKEVKNFQAFMAAYKQRLKDQKLSGIN
jgi:tetratricopeptide (TPR) repeat protein